MYRLFFKTDRGHLLRRCERPSGKPVVKRLGIKARNEKPGICGRASIAWQSPVDRDEAVLAGREALRAAMRGESGVMIGFIRDETPDGSYKIHVESIPIEQVMLYDAGHSGDLRQRAEK